MDTDILKILLASLVLIGTPIALSYLLKDNTSKDPTKMAAVLDMVKKLVADNVVMVFSKSYCPYCGKAKRALSNYAIKGMNVIELDNRQDGADIQAALKELTGGSSVPRVFIGGKFIGGGDDTARLHESGELKTMLEQAGAL